MSQSSLADHPRPRKTFRFLPVLCLLTLFLTLGSSVASAADILRVIVMFRDGTPTLVQQKLITQSHAKVVTWFPVVNAVVLELPAGSLLGTVTSLTSTLGLGSLLTSTVSTVETAVSFLSNHLGLEIEALEVDFYISLHPPGYVPKPLIAPAQPFPLEGGYRWNLRQIALDEVDWQVQGQGVHVAVLDTGIDVSHPLFAGRIGNGYNARIYETDKTDYMDHNGHGTHIAGIIGAAAGAPHASEVMRGVAPGVTLHPVRVLKPSGDGFLTDLISGLIWVYQHPQISVVNMSMGSTNSSRVLEKIIKKLYDAGVVMVVSSGNCTVTTTTTTSDTKGTGEGGDGEGGDSASSNQGCQQQEIKYPAAYWRTIAVGATDVDALVTYYSVTGPYLDVVAPGGTRQKGQVVSTNTTVSTDTASATTSSGSSSGLAANGEGGDGEGGDAEGGDGEAYDGEPVDGTTADSTGLYGLGRGTSQAAPHVTGVVALMRSVNPRLTPAQVQQILQETAVDLGAPAAAQGAGLIDAAHAVARAKSLR
jgi:subtilisin family serine protease